MKQRWRDISVLSARYRLVESCRAFHEEVTNAAGDKQLLVVVKEIEDEERVFRRTRRRSRVHTDFELSDPRNRNGFPSRSDREG